MPRWRRPQGRCTYWRGFRRRAPRRGEEGAWASLWAEVEDVAGADGSWICSEVPARGFLLFERSEPIQPSASPGRVTRSATAGWSATAGSWGDNRVKVDCKACFTRKDVCVYPPATTPRPAPHPFSICPTSFPSAPAPLFLLGGSGLGSEGSHREPTPR